MVAVVLMPSAWASRMTLQPGVGGDLVRADLAAHAINQRLGAAAGQRVEAGGLQTPQRLGRGQAALPGDVGDLRRRQAVKMDRVPRLDVGKDLLEPADVEVGRQSPLHHDRRAAQGQRLLDLAEDLVAAEQVALAAARRLVEGAEAAAREAVVGVIDVAVDDEGDVALRVQAAADFVGRRPQLEQVAVLEQLEGRSRREAVRPAAGISHDGPPAGARTLARRFVASAAVAPPPDAASPAVTPPPPAAASPAVAPPPAAASPAAAPPPPPAARVVRGPSRSSRRSSNLDQNGALEARRAPAGRR